MNSNKTQPEDKCKVRGGEKQIFMVLNGCLMVLSALSWKMGTMVGAVVLFLNTQHQANVITNLRVARPDLIKVVHVVKAFLSAGMACPAQCARSPPWHFDMRRAQRLYCSFHKKIILSSGSICWPEHGVRDLFIYSNLKGFKFPFYEVHVFCSLYDKKKKIY